MTRERRSRLLWAGAAALWAALEDLFAHAALYAVLAALLRGAGLTVPLALAAAFLYGVSDELHQRFVPGRTAALSDLAADLAGALLGARIGVGFLRRHRRGPRVE